MEPFADLCKVMPVTSYHAYQKSILTQSSCQSSAVEGLRADLEELESVPLLPCHVVVVHSHGIRGGSPKPRLLSLASSCGTRNDSLLVELPRRMRLDLQLVGATASHVVQVTVRSCGLHLGVSSEAVVIG